MSSASLYGVADLGRFGLGHRLLAWARCVIWCEQNGARMLAPNWLGVPLGPWLRKERDKRLYFRLFRSDAYISGIRRLRVLASTTRVDAAALLNSAPPNDRSCLVVFKNAVSGDAYKFFPTFLGHHELLGRELRRMTRRQYIPPPPAQQHIAIHVRLGDFSKVDANKLRLGAHSARLPMDWYVEMLTGVRTHLGIEVPAIVYSDGRDEEISPLMGLTNVTRAVDGPAVTHILSMARAGLLIGGGSGMGIWGSFLGQVPRLCFPGQRQLRAFVTEENEPECEFAREIPSAFIEALGPKLLPRR